MKKTLLLLGALTFAVSASALDMNAYLNSTSNSSTQTSNTSVTNNGAVLNTSTNFTTPSNITHTLSLVTSGGGYGYVTASSTSGTKFNNQTYRNRLISARRGTVIVLTATPTTGSVFAGWTGACAGSGTSTSCTITLTGNRQAAAKFSKAVAPLNNFERTSITGTCAIAALTKKDTAIVAAYQKYATDWIATINARTAAQVIAYNSFTSVSPVSVDIAIRAAAQTASTAQAAITTTLNTSKTAAQNTFRTEMRQCGIISTTLIETE